MNLLSATINGFVLIALVGFAVLTVIALMFVQRQYQKQVKEATIIEPSGWLGRLKRAITAVQCLVFLGCFGILVRQNHLGIAAIVGFGLVLQICQLMIEMPE